MAHLASAPTPTQMHQERKTRRELWTKTLRLPLTGGEILRRGSNHNCARIRARITGFEALARWTASGTRGVIPPAEFPACNRSRQLTGTAGGSNDVP